MSITHGRRLLFAQGPRATLESFAVPEPGPQHVVVRVTRSHVSAGTEMNFLRHGPAAYGLKDETRTSMPIGYMAVGRIVAMGSEVVGHTLGERVLTNGPHGSHWLVDCAKPNPVLEPVPEGVSDDAAGFATLAGVALHGVRRAALQIDESVVVFGAGLVGQLTLQLARLSGAYPLIAVDLSDARLAKARLGGATHVINASREDAAQAIRAITNGLGAEAVFHCTQVANIMQTLMESAAERGKVILTGSAPGVAPITLQNELLRRELTIIGTYAKGLDQPHPYWRWTPGRNRRACLRMLSTGDLRVDPLITHVVDPASAQATVEMMLRENDRWLGIVFKWD